VADVIHIGLGSNLGDRELQLSRAVDALRSIDAVAVLRCSSLFDSAPIGPPQARFLNAVAELECSLEPQRLLSILKHIESDLGRVPSGRWGPRAIDLDLLLWEQRVVADPNLQIPHLGLHQRRFILEPLCELVPDLVHPLLALPLCELLEKVGPQDVVRVGGSRWAFGEERARE
jgi:2-amino-4-hydroxy-6-hydroxymethyldihydropteridine diphosphokinase